MARVNVEDEALRDPRVRRLGRLLAPRLGRLQQRQLAIGVLVDIWEYMTERFEAPAKKRREDPEPTADPRFYRLSRQVLEDLTDVPEMAEHLLTAELGEVDASGEIRVKGAEGRIEWLGRTKRNGRHGGRPRPVVSAESLTNQKPEPNRTITGTEPDHNRNVTYPALALTPALALKDPPVVPQGDLLVLVEDPPNPNPTPAGPNPRSVTSDLTAYFAEQRGRACRPTDSRIRAVKRLLAEGHGFDDMRVVVWSKVHGPRKWLGDEKMDQCLTLETLLRPSHFEKYFEQAVEEFRAVNPVRAAELWPTKGAA